MALTRIKVWNPGDVLTAVDLNAEFNNIINNASTFPLTANVSFGGFSATNIAGLTMSAGEILQAQGTAIVSANAVLTLTTTGNNFHVTGSTGPILGYSAQQAGTIISVTYDSTPTLTHNGTSFILQGAQNYTAAAGFTHILVSEGAGNWREIARGGNSLGTPAGGTGVPTFTLNGVLYGNTTGNVLVTAQGPTNSVLTASAGAPSFSATPTVTSLTATSSITVGNPSTTTGSIVFNNATNNNTATINSGVTTGNTVWTWPTADGANLQVLQTNGSGVLSFKAIVARSIIGTGGLSLITSAAGGILFCPSYAVPVTSYATAVANAQAPIPFAGTLKNLYIRTGALLSQAYNWSVYINGVITGLTVTYQAAQPNITVSDVTHTVAVSAGDLLSLGSSSSTTSDTPLAGWSVEIDG